MHLSIHFGLANLTFKIQFELDLHGAHLTWAMSDSVREEQQRKLPPAPSAPGSWWREEEMDERFRRAGA